MEVLGIDIGGTGIKAAPVDVLAGKLTKERVKVPTPARRCRTPSRRRWRRHLPTSWAWRCAMPVTITNW